MKTPEQRLKESEDKLKEKLKGRGDPRLERMVKLALINPDLTHLNHGPCLKVVK